MHENYFIAYCSEITLTAALHQDTFTQILNQSIQNNTRSGITGFLLYDAGKFFQYFEGEELACENLLHALKHDDRHTNLKVIGRGYISNPIFKNWFMGCFDLSKHQYTFNHHQLITTFDVYSWGMDQVSQLIDMMSNQHITFTTPPKPIKSLLSKRFMRIRNLNLPFTKSTDQNI